MRRGNPLVDDVTARLVLIPLAVPLLEGPLWLGPRADGKFVPVEENVQFGVLSLYLLDLVEDLAECELRVVPVYPHPDSLAQGSTYRRNGI